MSSSSGTHTVSRTSRIVQAILCGLIALFVWRKLGHTYAAIVISLVGATVLILGLTIPRVLAPIDRFAFKLATWVGVGLTWLTLVPFYGLCMVPGRLVLLALGRDPMRRGLDKTATSYWTAKSKKSGGPHAQF